MSIPPLSIQMLDAKNLSTHELQRLQTLTTNIFADDEYAQCTSCKTVFSWGDLGKAPNETISPNKYNLSGDCCPHCTGKLEKMYTDDYASVLQRRFSSAIQTSLSVSVTEGGDWVGYTHAYSTSFQKIFSDPLFPHFQNIPIETMRERVQVALGTPFSLDDTFYYISFIGLLKEFSSGPNIFQQLQSLQSPEEGIVGISEDDKRSGIYKVLCRIATATLSVEKTLQSNAHPQSDWHLLFYKNCGATYNSYLENGLKGFCQKIREGRKPKNPQI